MATIAAVNGIVATGIIGGIFAGTGYLIYNYAGEFFTTASSRAGAGLVALSSGYAGRKQIVSTISLIFAATVAAAVANSISNLRKRYELEDEENSRQMLLALNNIKESAKEQVSMQTLSILSTVQDAAKKTVNSTQERSVISGFYKAKANALKLGREIDDARIDSYKQNLGLSSADIEDMFSPWTQKKDQILNCFLLLKTMDLNASDVRFFNATLLALTPQQDLENVVIPHDAQRTIKDRNYTLVSVTEKIQEFCKTGFKALSLGLGAAATTAAGVLALSVKFGIHEQQASACFTGVKHLKFSECQHLVSDSPYEALIGSVVGVALVVYLVAFQTQKLMNQWSERAIDAENLRNEAVGQLSAVYDGVAESVSYLNEEDKQSLSKKLPVIEKIIQSTKIEGVFGEITAKLHAACNRSV